MAMPLTQSQQIRLLLVQQKGPLTADTPADVDTWVNYIIGGVPIDPVGIITQGQFGNNTIVKG